MKPGASAYSNRNSSLQRRSELPGLIAAQIDISRPISTTALIGGLKKIAQVGGVALHEKD
jgi:hypothetical protein